MARSRDRFDGESGVVDAKCARKEEVLEGNCGDFCDLDVEDAAYEEASEHMSLRYDP